ncbi:MAG: hypothetical protein IKP92_03265 [Lachnospiraceae bacterium]|nr:hypothetical protein [Lachnospiraceae bacterium]
MENTMNVTLNKLTYDEFQGVLAEKVQRKLDEKIEVRINDVRKNNGVVLKGMSFNTEGDGISPTVYLESYYEAYLNGMEWVEIVDRIVDIFRMGSREKFFDIRDFLDYERAKGRIVYKLINKEKNEELLKSIPHRDLMDMTVVFYYLLENKDMENATILIYNNHLESWGITEDELYEAAKENTPKVLTPELKSITEVLTELLSARGIGEVFEEEEEEFGMYVLSNRTKIFGAAAILYDDVLKNFAGKTGADLYILPSSVHEVILVPKKDGITWEALQEMVKEVNETQVEDVEVLSDSVYCYLKDEEKLCLASEAFKAA